MPQMFDEDYSWIEHAACKGMTHLFYGHVSERPQATHKREEKARKICNTCDVFEQCRNYARSNREYGFWAGENEYDRSLAGFGPANIKIRRSSVYRRAFNTTKGKDIGE